MTSAPFTLQIDVGAKISLLMIRGNLAPATVEEARQTHNQTAGNDAGVAAARSLGDLSHAVFVPLGGARGAASELLIMDQWNSLAGLNQFFSNPQVEKGGGLIFKSREPVVWEPADGLPSCHMPPPATKRERYVGIVRGKVHSREQARVVFSGAFAKSINQARKLGLLSREYFYRVGEAGPGPSNELLGVDVWYSAEGMNEQYARHEDMGAIGALFTARPATSVWEQPAGEWVEW
jgi:hypothetical protein